MAAGDLKQMQFDLAFTFSRSEAAAYRAANGAEQYADVNVARFDHDEAGSSLGFLVTAGSDLGTADRTKLDPLMLPESLVEGVEPGELEATVFHAFIPLGSATGEVERRAWYSRNAKVTADALLAQQGHHLDLGVITGFRENLGGFVRLRGEVWTLAGLLVEKAAGAALVNSSAVNAKPVIVAGAEVI